jgi:uncharacterized membrane protein
MKGENVIKLNRNLTELVYSGIITIEKEHGAMWKSKKILIPVILAVVVLIGGTAGIVLAQDNTGTGTQTPAVGPGKNLDRVCQIYQEKYGVAIDPTQLQAAFTQAQQEARDKALDDRLQKLEDAGTITPEQAQQYKTWLNSRPSMDQYNEQFKQWMQSRPSLPPDVEQWQSARPDIPMRGQFKMGPGFGRFGRMPHWGGGTPPAQQSSN